jgi:predicted nucleic acid-binding protein
MVLADTSIWVSHFRDKNPRLQALLLKGQVSIHPYIIGELACSNLKNRNEILSLLQALPTAVLASHEEVLHFINKHRLMGIGLGYIDVHLLASSLLSGALLWTKDKKLREAANEMGIGSL